jgi:hypothetical protein
LCFFFVLMFLFSFSDSILHYIIMPVC